MSFRMPRSRGASVLGLVDNADTPAAELFDGRVMRDRLTGHRSGHGRRDVEASQSEQSR